MDPRQLEALAKRLGQNPADSEALQAAYAHGQADPRGYAVFLEKAGAASTDPANAAHWFVEASTVWQTGLGDAHRAVRALMAAVDKDPTHEGAAEKLTAIYREKGDLKGVVALLDRRAKLLEKMLPARPDLSDLVSTVLIELARVQAEELGRPDGALIAYKRASALNPSDAYSIYMARELLKNAGRFAECLPYYALEQQLLEQSGDTERALALYLDEAEVSRSAGDRGNLLRALRQARLLDKADDATLKQQLGSVTLERLQAGEKVPDDDRAEAYDLFVSLAESYDGEYGYSYASCALGCDPGGDRAMQLVLYYGDALNRSLESAPLAAAYLARSPEGAMVSEAKELVSEVLSRVFDEGLIAALRPQKDAPAEARAQAWATIGRAYATHARRNEAEKSFREALAAQPSQGDAVSFLRDSLKSAGKHRELRDLLTAAAKDEAANLSDRLGWYGEVAALCEGPLRDVAAALEARRQLVLLDPSDEQAADHLEASLIEAKKWDELAELISRRIELTTDLETKLSRLRDLVEVHRTKRQDPAGAARALASLARLEPDEPEHTEGAVDLFLAAGVPTEAIQLLVSLLGEMLGSEVRARYSERLAPLLGDQGDHAGAGGAYAEAAGLVGSADLWARAEAEFVAIQAWEQAARAAHERVQLTHLAPIQAELLALQASYLDRLGDVEGSTGCLAQAVQLAPGEAGVAAELGRRYEAAGRFHELVHLLLTRAVAPENEKERAPLFKQAAFLQRDQLRDGEGMRAALVQLLDYEEDEEALQVLADDAESSGSRLQAIDYLTRLIVLLSGGARTETVLRKARLYEELGDEPQALTAYEEAIALEPSHEAAWTARARLQLSLRDYEGAVTSLRELTKLTTGETRLDHARQLAEVLDERIGDQREAFRAYQVVLGLDAEDLASVARLAALADELSLWEDFVRYQTQLVEVEGDDDEAARLGMRLAEVLVQRLSRPEDAMNVLEQFAAAGVDAARDEYVRLGDELNIPGEVARALTQWLKDAPSGPKRNHGLRAAYDRYIRAGMSAEARQIGLELVQLKGVDLEVARTLEALAREAFDVESLRAAFGALGRDLSGYDRAEEAVRQAEVLVLARLPSSDAIRHGEQAMPSAPPSEAEPLLRRLSALADDPVTEVAVYERQVGRCRSPEEQRHALCRAAEMALSLELAAKAFELLSVGVASSDPEEGLEELIEEVRQADERAGSQALRRVLLDVLSEAGRAVRDAGKSRASYLRRAATLALDELNDAERAYGFFQDSLIAHVDDETLEALEQAATDQNDLGRADTVLGAALEAVHDTPLLRILLRRRHSLRLERLQDRAGAAEDLKRLYELSPGDAEIAEQLEEYFVESDDHRGLVHLYEDRILRSRDPNLRSTLARKVAAIWQEKLKNPRETADAWRRVLRMSPNDADAKDKLEKAKLEMRKVTAADLAISEQTERQAQVEASRVEIEERKKAMLEQERIRKQKSDLLKKRLSESLPPPPPPKSDMPSRPPEEDRDTPSIPSFPADAPIPHEARAEERTVELSPEEARKIIEQAASKLAAGLETESAESAARGFASAGEDEETVQVAHVGGLPADATETPAPPTPVVPMSHLDAPDELGAVAARSFRSQDSEFPSASASAAAEDPAALEASRAEVTAPAPVVETDEEESAAPEAQAPAPAEAAAAAEPAPDSSEEEASDQAPDTVEMPEVKLAPEAAAEPDADAPAPEALASGSDSDSDSDSEDGEDDDADEVDLDDTPLDEVDEVAAPKAVSMAPPLPPRSGVHSSPPSRPGAAPAGGIPRLVPPPPPTAGGARLAPPPPPGPMSKAPPMPPGAPSRRPPPPPGGKK